MSTEVGAVPSNTDLIDVVVEDLARPLEKFLVDNEFEKAWLPIARTLPVGAAQTLSEIIDNHSFEPEESAGRLALRIGVRQVFNGPPPSASELLELDPSELTTKLTSSWLTLSPPAAEMQTLITTARFNPQDLRTYCDSQTLSDRTSFWLELAKTNSPHTTLKATGEGGVGHLAVQYIHNLVTAAELQADRVDAVKLLTATSRPSSSGSDEIRATRKAASELAKDLLELNQTKEVRAAADLVIWAGGAAYGYTTELRAHFTQACANKKSILPHNITDQLKNLGLIEVPKSKSWILKPFRN